MKPRFKRVFLIVLDSVGIGEMPDANEYDDVGSHTLKNIAEHMNGLTMPNMGAFGLGNIENLKGIPAVHNPLAHYGKMAEASVGKDTMTGHWELMGLHIREPFLTFPNGFPQELIHKIEHKTGRPVIGNKVASGTEIIQELGEEHIKTGALIVYTSADSVLQIAAHEQIVPIKELHTICEQVREMTLEPNYKVGRIIARPFIGENGNWQRTANRHDYALKPFARTVMNELVDTGFASIAIGKIRDIYDGEGITEAIRTISNDDGLDKIIATTMKDFTGLSFVNLVDFDALYGHRRNPQGYGEALEAFDLRLAELKERLKDGDLLIITADHGNDPTHHGTDHTREYVPLLVHYKGLNMGKNLGVRRTFADVGATIADNFGVSMPRHGRSFLEEI